MTDFGRSPTFLQLQEIVCDAAEAIMAIYQQADLGIEQKSDNSPVTAADVAAHGIIRDGLMALTPDIPILSEEAVVPYEQRIQWQRLWVVDPLDGTKEFIKRNGEFSINIALVDNGRPIVGVVYLPTTAEGYIGVTENWQGLPLGAYKWHGERIDQISVREPRAPLVAMTSRSHGPSLPESLRQTLTDEFDAVRELPKGSSIKGCRIAEGIADLHLRRGPTSEWDTAAQQAVIEAAGGALLTPTGEPFRYNQRKTLLNGHFFVAGPTIAPYVMAWYEQSEES